MGGHEKYRIFHGINFSKIWQILKNLCREICGIFHAPPPATTIVNKNDKYSITPQKLCVIIFEKPKVTLVVPRVSKKQ
jgi:hypothetical protein